MAVLLSLGQSIEGRSRASELIMINPLHAKFFREH